MEARARSTISVAQVAGLLKAYHGSLRSFEWKSMSNVDLLEEYQGFFVAVASMTARLNESCVRDALTEIMGWKKEDAKGAAQRLVSVFVHCQQKKNLKNRVQATRC